MTRLIRRVVAAVAAVAIWVVSGCTAVEGRAGPGQVNSTCVYTVDFDSQDSRGDFLRANLTTIAQQVVSRHDAFVYSPTNQNRLLVAVTGQDCRGDGNLAPLVSTNGIVGVRSELRDNFDPDIAFEPLDESPLRSSPPICVVTASDPLYPQRSRLGLFVSELRYGGVRGISALQVGPKLYVASNDECALTVAFVEAVASELGMPEVETQTCNDHTARECQAPFEVLQ